MKASADKSSTSSSTTTSASQHEPFFAKAGGGGFFAPVQQTSSPAVQFKLTVNKPGDKFEQEADKMADKVMRMPAAPAPAKEDKLPGMPPEKLQKKEEDKIQKAAMLEEKVQKQEKEKIQKAPAAEDKLQRKGDGTPTVGADTHTAIQKIGRAHV